jgi:DNA-nicking Smr family endonuclease
MKPRLPTSLPHDFDLWEEVKGTIKPLAKNKKKKIAKTEALHIAKPSAVLMQTSSAMAPPPVVKTAVPPLASFERRTAQKLGRGQMEPDATIDLHGHGLEESYIRLLRFIESHRRKGSRLLLVITGKGASPYGRHTLHGHTHFHSPEREGRIRREVPMWLEETRFRQHVVGYQPAHPRHGGGGAYYVRLRKAHT